MGFFDSIAGFGRAAIGGIGSLLETGLNVFGPTLAQAGVQALGGAVGLQRSAPSPFNITPRSALPGGAPIGFAPRGARSFFPMEAPMPAFPVSRQAPSLFPLIPGVSELLGLAPQQQQLINGGGGACPGFFAPGAMTSRPVSEISVMNPATGRTHVWKHMGRPILFSGDVATCKRVGKIARRARVQSRKR